MLVGGLDGLRDLICVRGPLVEPVPDLAHPVPEVREVPRTNDRKIDEPLSYGGETLSRVPECGLHGPQEVLQHPVGQANIELIQDNGEGGAHRGRKTLESGLELRDGLAHQPIEGLRGSRREEALLNGLLDALHLVGRVAPRLVEGLRGFHRRILQVTEGHCGHNHSGAERSDAGGSRQQGRDDHPEALAEGGDGRYR